MAISNGSHYGTPLGGQLTKLYYMTNVQRCPILGPKLGPKWSKMAQIAILLLNFGTFWTNFRAQNRAFLDIGHKIKFSQLASQGCPVMVSI